MTRREAGRKLRAMYEAGKRNGRSATGIQMFAITYAAETTHLSPQELVIESGIRHSYMVDILDGRRLAE